MKTRSFKSYKSKDPIETITLIRQQLKEWGILLNENSRVYHDFHSCRLTFSDKAISSFNIGTNGKGRTYAFSLASGYAEFMERLQNRMIFDANVIREIIQVLKENPESDLSKMAKKSNLFIDYVYDQNEVYQEGNEILSYLQKSSISIFSHNINDEKAIRNLISDKVSNTSMALIPFYSVYEDKEVFLPIDLCLCSTGSNGMCAGNTFKEAFLQGVCEIFERYSILNVYFNHICPPSIPITYFAGTESERMYTELTSAGFKIRIMDCSLGIGLPVIGAIIVNEANHSYNIKFGADFLPHIALERCLTEAFQSARGFNGLPTTSTWIDESLDLDMDSKYDNFNKIIKNSSGVWPSSIFGDKPSYKFCPFPESYGRSDTNDVLIAKELIRNLGYKMYVRDNTASEIPALYIFIPGLSGTYFDANHFMHNNKLFYSEWFSLLDNMDSLDEPTMKRLLEELKKMSISDLSKIELRWFSKYDSHSDMNTIDIRQLIFMLSYRTGDIKTSIALLQILSKENSSAKIYYAIAAKYVALFDKGYTNKEIESMLNKIFPSSIISEVFDDFSSSKEILKNYVLSKRIKEMKDEEVRGLIKIIEIYMRLNKSFVSKNVKQSMLKEIFEMHEKDNFS